MHVAARMAGCLPKKVYKPKAYWCPELSQLRDRKRFWWAIWVANGRPRHGVVFECYKGVKKLFRKTSRKKIQNVIENRFEAINHCFSSRNINSFWNKIKAHQTRKISSSLNAQIIADFYRDVMCNDSTPFDECQQMVHITVKTTCREWSAKPEHIAFTDRQIERAIIALRKNVSPGIDGITDEHFIFGNCESLRTHLKYLYNGMFQEILVPSFLKTGIIIPILKKSTLDPNVPNNYRPITLSSTHGKLIEFLILPQDTAHSNQFGYREGRGTSMACTFINDLLQYCSVKGSNVFICSLDAEKCFDSIWHEGLFYKLLDILPKSHWLFLYRWYQSMKCVVRWDGTHSQCFRVLRGTKQGSILSPTIFDIFINDLLVELSASGVGIRIEDELFNSFAYADDINLMCLKTNDLQILINLCYQYSRKWRFSFGINKTHCMISNKNPFIKYPSWNLGGYKIKNAETLEILGTMFTSNISCDAHIDKRVNASRRTMYALATVGCSYPGLATEVKVHLWKTIGLPSLLYNLEIFKLKPGQQKFIESVQSSIIKRIVGFPKRSHHTALLQAVNIDDVMSSVTHNTLSLWWRLF